MSEEYKNQENFNVETPGITEDSEPITKLEAVTGVITEPITTFSKLSNYPDKNYWLIPMLIFIIANLISLVLSFTDPELIDATMKEQRAKIEKKFDEQVKKGEMTEEQKKTTLEATEKFMNPKSPIFMLIAVAGVVISPLVVMFLVAAIYLLILKILGSSAGFPLSLNVVSLSFVIGSIGKILETVVSIILGKITTFSLSALLSAEQINSFLYQMAFRFDVFSIWMLIISCIGLAYGGKVNRNTVFAILIGLWLAWSALMSYLLPMFQ